MNCNAPLLPFRECVQTLHYTLLVTANHLLHLSARLLTWCYSTQTLLTQQIRGSVRRASIVLLHPAGSANEDQNSQIGYDLQLAG